MSRLRADDCLSLCHGSYDQPNNLTSSALRKAGVVIVGLFSQAYGYILE